MKAYFWLMITIYSNILFSYNQEQLKQIQSDLASNKKINLSHVDLRGLGNLLINADFSNAQLAGALFSKISSNPTPIFAGLIQIPNQISDLSGVNFSNACCVSASFVGCVLKNANFNGADIAYADFTDADLTGATFVGALNIELALFCNATMPDGSLNNKKVWQDADGQKFFSHCSAQ